ncbi:MAG: glutamate--tRNA ligase [Pirellula sp.]|jgi:glutamyl-tRNA synthetase|nr:glutamate--tRNA ligase [Pirellula sp.]
MTIRTRFAPSPTGYLHIGGVRTALFNYLLARQAGGQFLLRIDDTDQVRNVEAALQPILEGFRWLGLQWDEGPDVGGPYQPYFQSQRLARYQEAVDTLLRSGHAYRDYAKPEELAAAKAKAEQEGKSFIYDRSFMATDSEQEARYQAEGRTSVVRLKMPREGQCVIQDGIRGECRFEWSDEQDHVIQRADGTCLYHLASVVDDYDFAITHVVRAVEHLPNTPRQIFIAQSLGYPLPIYAHLPYVAEPGGTAKLSKRKLDKYLKQKDFATLFQLGDAIAKKAHLQTTPETFNPVVVDFYRETGFLPGAILNYLLLLGWSLDDSTEHFTLDDAIKHFSLERVNKAPASFDPQKLLAFQARWMSQLDIKKKVAMVLPFAQKAGWIESPPPCATSDYLTRVVTAAADRIKVAGDILQFDELFTPDEKLDIDSDLLAKRIKNEPRALEALQAIRSGMEANPGMEPAALESWIKEYATAQGLKLGVCINALRVALTGKSTGLGVFDYVDLLGRDRCMSRIDRAIQLAAMH